ncbi:sugar phosphate isomerase/epimerase, partial [bacterium]
FSKWQDDQKTVELKDLSHRSLLAAGMLGIPWVVFEPETARGAWDAAHIKALIQRNVDWFAPLVETAEQANTGLALENVTDEYAQSGRGASRWIGAVPAELIDLVDAFASHRVGVCWDTGHAFIQKVEQGGAIRAFGSRLKALHIQDNDGLTDQHLAPFYGQVPWQDIMSALRDIQYSGDFTFEIHNFIRPLPDALRDEAMRLAVSIGRNLLTQENF